MTILQNPFKLWWGPALVVLLLSLLNTAKSDPSGMQFNIGTGVPNSAVNVMSNGISLARSHLNESLSGDIALAYRQSSEVKMVATGDGNQERGGGGSCCTALAESTPYGRIFIDVLHPDWLGESPLGWINDRTHTAAHEYAHVWQNYLGCLTISYQPLGFWLNEGIASYVGYQAQIDAGMLSRAQVHQFMYNSALFTGQLNYSLQSLASNFAPVWPGHVGYLAVSNLISNSPNGYQSVRLICSRVASGQSFDQAFQSSFGLSPDAFYNQFTASPVAPPLPEDLSNPASAIAPLLPLILN